VSILMEHTFNGAHYVVNLVCGTSLTNSIDRESLWMVNSNGVVGERKVYSNLIGTLTDFQTAVMLC